MPDESKWLPYGRHSIDEKDVAEVSSVLRSDWLTTGPKVQEFEAAIADYVGARYAVAVSSGTAALHCAMYAIGISSGDEVILPPMTFAATANCVLYQSGLPVFADVTSDTLLLNPDEVEMRITDRTRAIVAVDYAGHPCSYDRLQIIAQEKNLKLVADSCHALGAKYRGRKVGSLADLSIFSFHPVKHIATGEGGIITTDNPEYYEKLRLFRSHGISSDLHQRRQSESWFYEMIDLGFNYRITDFQCALGLSQLNRLPEFLTQRNNIASAYTGGFSGYDSVTPLAVKDDVFHAYHLYVIKLRPGLDRTKVYQKLIERKIGVNVHYIPVHRHPYYRKTLGTHDGMCPNAEDAYEQIISLPIFPAMRIEDAQYVIDNLKDVIDSLDG
jgi:perosamine synthetase